MIRHQLLEDIYTRYEQNLWSNSCISKSIAVQLQNHLLLGLLLFLICDILNIRTTLKQGSQLHQSTAKIF